MATYTMRRGPRRIFLGSGGQRDTPQRDANALEMAVAAAGLSATQTSKMERREFHELLHTREGVQQLLRIRNRILMLWHLDVTTEVLPSDSERIADHKHEKEFALRVHKLLEKEWCINLGRPKGEGPRSDGQVAEAKRLAEEGEAEIKGKDPLEAKALALLRERIKSTDLSATTERQLRSQLEAELGQDLSEHKQALREEIRNFLSPSDQHAPAPESSHPEGDLAGARIAVVGAGPAGLAAARHLKRRGGRPTLFEARARLGGRVYTSSEGKLSTMVDLGASIITGTEPEPWRTHSQGKGARPDPSAIVCRQNGVDMHRLNPEWLPLYDPENGGDEVDPAEDERVGKERDKLMDEAQARGAALYGDQEGEEDDTKKRKRPESLWEALVMSMKDEEGTEGGEEQEKTALQRRLLEWHWANLEYGCSAELSEVNVTEWNQDERFGGFGGRHCMVNGGYSQVVETMAEGLDVRLGARVKRVAFDEQGKKGATLDVEGESQESVEVDGVVVAVPLGCLKEGQIAFTPSLPEWKAGAISRMGMGKLEKVVLEFPHRFWDSRVDFFGILPREPDETSRGRCFMFWNLEPLSGKPMLVGLLSGRAAKERSNEPEQSLVEKAVVSLRACFGESTVPEPVGSVVTSWGDDEFSRGSYSFVASGASADDYDMLATSLWEGRLCFAGEHTCKEHPDTVGGAMLSGIRAANSVTESITGEREQEEAEVNREEEGSKGKKRKRAKAAGEEKTAGEAAARVREFDSGNMKERAQEARVMWDELGFDKRNRRGESWANAARIASLESSKLSLLQELADQRTPPSGLSDFALHSSGIDTLSTWVQDAESKGSGAILEAGTRALARLVHAADIDPSSSPEGNKLLQLAHRAESSREEGISEAGRALKGALGAETEAETLSKEKHKQQQPSARSLPEHLRQQEEEDMALVELARRQHDEAVDEWRRKQAEENGEEEEGVPEVPTFDEFVGHGEKGKRSKERKKSKGKNTEEGGKSREEKNTEEGGKSRAEEKNTEEGGKSEAERFVSKVLKGHYEAGKLGKKQFRKVRDKVVQRVVGRGATRELSGKDKDKMKRLAQAYVDSYQKQAGSSQQPSA